MVFFYIFGDSYCHFPSAFSDDFVNVENVSISLNKQDMRIRSKINAEFFNAVRSCQVMERQQYRPIPSLGPEICVTPCRQSVWEPRISGCQEREACLLCAKLHGTIHDVWKTNARPSALGSRVLLVCVRPGTMGRDAARWPRLRLFAKPQGVLQFPLDEA